MLQIVKAHILPGTYTLANITLTLNRTGVTEIPSVGGYVWSFRCTFVGHTLSAYCVNTLAAVHLQHGFAMARVDLSTCVLPAVCMTCVLPAVCMTTLIPTMIHMPGSQC